jgi:hypothetical protein
MSTADEHGRLRGIMASHSSGMPTENSLCFSERYNNRPVHPYLIDTGWKAIYRDIINDYYGKATITT